jgi:hypothetical protein
MSGPEQFINGRIVGGCSLHDAEDATKCNGYKCGPWRVVECGGHAGEDRDIVECATCGKQKKVACDFDEEFS